MRVNRTKLTLEEQAELEAANALKEKLETQKLLLQYVAEMQDIPIPEEEDINNVRNIEEVEK